MLCSAWLFINQTERIEQGLPLLIPKHLAYLHNSCVFIKLYLFQFLLHFCIDKPKRLRLVF
jgi:hypothetical protein